MSATVSPSDTYRPGFLHNVIWGWVGVAINVAIGVLLIPIIMRKLGVERYGLWVLIFSVVDYMRVLDFGFRAAVINGVARFRERQDWDGVNRTVVTALAYFFSVAAACVLVAWIVRIPLATALVGGETYPPDPLVIGMRQEASVLIVLVALAVSIRLVSSPVTATLEGFVRFDLVNRAYIGALLLRSIASLAVLFLGFGLVEMALVVLAAQIGEAAYIWSRVKRLVPQLRVSREGFDRQVFKGLFGYGRYSAVISAANLVSINAPATVLGSVRTAAEVGFFSLPYRLLMYSAEALAKVSDVTASVTAGLDERGDRQRVWDLAVLTNRHCFALYMPVAIFLSIYGTPLLRLMVTEEVAAQSGDLFRILVIGFLFAIAGQYNAGAVLIGQGRHSVYAYGALVEACATIVLLLLVVPASGIEGAAWVVSLAILAGRGVFLALMLCRMNAFPVGRYLVAVYGHGVMAALPIVFLALWLERTVLPGDTWIQLIAAGATIAGAYFILGFFFVLRPEHRHAVLRRAGLAG